MPPKSEAAGTEQKPKKELREAALLPATKTVKPKEKPPKTKPKAKPAKAKPTKGKPAKKKKR